MNDFVNNFETFSLRTAAVKKSGSKIISFPKSRRTEQTGLTQRGFPVKWLGLLLMTSVGAAWAVSPGVHKKVPAAVEHPGAVSYTHLTLPTIYSV